LQLFDLVVVNGSVVTSDGVHRADVAVSDGRIAAIGNGFEGKQTIDAARLYILPGGVDSHCHIEQPSPGPTEMCDTFESGTASAAAGGTTTVIPFAWQPRGVSLAETVRSYREVAKRARVDYAFHLTITDPTTKVLQEEIPALVEEGCRSIKIFMTYDGVRLNDTQVLEVLAAARQHGALVCVHAEHHELIAFLTKQLIEAGLTEPKYHAWAKPTVVEREAVSRIIAMAEALDVPIQIFHVSSPEPAEEIARAQARGLKVYAETCPQYLTLTAEDLDRPGFEGAKYIFSPAARSAAESEGLWGYLLDGTIGVVSSDHSPSRFDDPKGKKVGGENAPFNRIPNGIPGLAARLPLLYHEGVAGGRIDICKFVDLVSTEPAKLMGLYPRKGSLMPGADADFLLWDPKGRSRISNANQFHGSDYTPYEGRELEGRLCATYLRGTLIYDGERVVGEAGKGCYLPRQAYAQIMPRGVFPTPFNPVDKTVTN
jgi:dihydropyrimidinase